MSAVAWLALAVALILGSSTRAGSRIRIAALVRAGRLAPAPPQPRQAASRRRAVRAVAPVSLAVLVVGVAVASGPALATAALVTGSTVGALVRQWLHRRAMDHADGRHSAALKLLVAELRAGTRPDQALRAASDVDPGGTWRRAADEVAAAGDPVSVLSAGQRSSVVGHAWHVAARTGAPLADVLDRVAADHTAGAGQRRAVATLLAGPRASAAVLAVLPCVGVVLGIAMGLHPLSTLLHTDAGRLLCCVGSGFDAAGVLWTSRIVTAAERS